MVKEVIVRVSGGFSLRGAKETDCELLWWWRNEESTRIWFGNTSLIPFSEHKRWFLDKLHSTDTKILIVVDENAKEVGQVRLHMLSNMTAEIRISIDGSERSRGVGTSAIRLACRYAAEELGITRIVAYIKEGNEASVKAFRKAGFTDLGVGEFTSGRALVMEFKVVQDKDENSY